MPLAFYTQNDLPASAPQAYVGRPPLTGLWAHLDPANYDPASSPALLTNPESGPTFSHDGFVPSLTNPAQYAGEGQADFRMLDVRGVEGAADYLVAQTPFVWGDMTVSFYVEDWTGTVLAHTVDEADPINSAPNWTHRIVHIQSAWRWQSIDTVSGSAADAITPSDYALPFKGAVTVSFTPADGTGAERARIWIGRDLIVDAQTGDSHDYAVGDDIRGQFVLGASSDFERANGRLGDCFIAQTFLPADSDLVDELNSYFEQRYDW